jgi:hypothetical protein
MEEMIKKVVHKKPEGLLGAITMHVVENIIMEKVFVSYQGPCFDDNDLVVFWGEFLVVSSLNITNVI